MALHPETFDYLRPTLEQVGKMNTLRAAAKAYAYMLDKNLPDGPDKTFVLRRLREVAMWVNAAITRHPDGSPRQSPGDAPRDYPADHPVEGDLGSVPL